MSIAERHGIRTPEHRALPIVDQLVLVGRSATISGLRTNESSCRKKREVDLFHVIGVKVFVQGWKVNDGVLPDGGGKREPSEPLADWSSSGLRGLEGREGGAKGDRSGGNLHTFTHSLHLRRCPTTVPPATS